MWASDILLRYAEKSEIGNVAFPGYARSFGLVPFLIDNYELFHLYPDDAVLDEVDKEIRRQSDD